MKVVIRGKPKTGKTTLITEIIKCLDIPWVGFYTQEITEGGVRRGFKIIDMDGTEKIFAHVNVKSGYKVGKYGIDIKSLEDTIDRIENIKDAKIYIIDEIGKMELYSHRFKNFVTAIFNSSTSVLATMKFNSDEFCDELLRRHSCMVFSLKKENYIYIKREILNLISKFSAT